MRPKTLEKLLAFLKRLAKEPPFRLFVKAIIKRLPTSIQTKADWDVVSRPHYLLGVLTAANQAISERISEISVIEFGVAGGRGLLALEEYAAWVERKTQIKIAIYGFDSGIGLPEMSGDYRDHPDQWTSMDYPMDEQLLREQLSTRTTLIIGNVAQTVPEFARNASSSPIGFIAFDLDLYSSTRDALQILLLTEQQLLRRVMMYFDDINLIYNHKFAGELLAIDEFNQTSDTVKIARWRGIEQGRAFPEEPFLRKMYIAHNLEAISQVRLNRFPSKQAKFLLQ